VDRLKLVRSDVFTQPVHDNPAPKPIREITLPASPLPDESAEDPSESTPAGAQPWLNVMASRNFSEWLAERPVSLGITTYQAGKLLLLGHKPDHSLAVFERTFNRCMGLCAAPNGQTLWLSSRFQLWRFENVLAEGTSASEFDRLYVPRVGYTTGDIDVHDLAVAPDGQVVFVNTLFSCLATISPRYNFEVQWRPPFISRLAAEDRCHLNGLALRDGHPRYVTLCGQTDVVDGWRDCRTDGGCVMDVTTNEIVCDGLSMPHSPRWHGDRLWLLEAGTGWLGFVDFPSGRFQRATFCGSFPRGLAIVGNYAVVGLSLPRNEPTFQGLPLDNELAQRRAVPRCGLLVVDLISGDAVHWVRIEGKVHELYDVVALPGVRRPKALGFATDEIQRNVWFEEHQQMSHWTAAPRDIS
jgi:uncharacterized protein (TIGR03032 family)